MQTWKDKAGREWRFDVNMWTCREVKRLAGWDLPNILNDGLEKLSQLLSDTDELFSVFLVLLNSQMDERGVTPEQFGSSLDGDVLLSAVKAFQEALADFFQEADRKKLRAILKKSQEVVEVLSAKADQKIAELEAMDAGVLSEQVLSGLALSVSSRGDSP